MQKIYLSMKVKHRESIDQSVAGDARIDTKTNKLLQIFFQSISKEGGSPPVGPPPWVPPGGPPMGPIGDPSRD